MIRRRRQEKREVECARAKRGLRGSGTHPAVPGYVTAPELHAALGKDPAVDSVGLIMSVTVSIVDEKRCRAARGRSECKHCKVKMRWLSG